MKKYVASTQKAEVIGAALQAYNESILRADFESILRTYSLTHIDPEKWYPQQLTLDIQHAIKKSVDGGNMLVSIGMKIIDTANFPPMGSLQEALGAFASSYPMNFRNQASEDIIISRLINDRHIKVINKSPHSDEMVYGYVYAMVRRFAPKNQQFTVAFEDLRLIDADGDTVINIMLQS